MKTLSEANILNIQNDFLRKLLVILLAIFLFGPALIGSAFSSQWKTTDEELALLAKLYAGNNKHKHRFHFLWTVLFMLPVLLLACSSPVEILPEEPLYLSVTEQYGVDAISAVVCYKTNGERVSVFSLGHRYDGPGIGSIEYQPVVTDTIVIRVYRDTDSLSNFLKW